MSPTTNAPLIRFGTKQFVAAANKDEGLPNHAVQVEGRLIHLGQKNLGGWGVVAGAAEQIMAAIPGVPIRACSSLDPHACDYVHDTKSHIGYGLRSWVEGEWLLASAAITDPLAAKHIADGTWTPHGKGGWSVAGLPTKKGAGFEATGLVDGYQPTGISLVFAPSTPAFVGSGFDMVVAAVNYDHRGDNMEKNDGGGTDPITYSQDDLDTKIKEALEAQKTETEAEAKKLADADLAKQKTAAAEALAKQKVEYDAAIEKLSTDDKAAYDARLAEMTPTVDVEKMIAAAVTQGQADTLEAIERDKLVTEYEGMLTASVVVGAPIMTDGVVDPAKLAGKMTAVREMKVAAISTMIADAKMMVAASSAPGQSAFEAANVPGTPPGQSTDAELLADLEALDNGTGAR